MNFLDRFSKDSQILNFMEIRSVGDELFCADGQTDVKLIVPFRNVTIASNLLKHGNIFNKSRHVMHVACSTAGS
jgi:hypothetical protein